MSLAQPDVTVVIGAYEAMPYLVACLDSVEAQTLDHDRIEVIAVDDGSTDGTGAVSYTHLTLPTNREV